MTTIPETAEPDGTTRVEEAAEAVVASRRALTAAERRAKRLREEHQGSPEAERAEQDCQLAKDAHRLALGRLSAALRAAATSGVDHEHAEDDFKAAIRGFNRKARQERL